MPVLHCLGPKPPKFHEPLEAVGGSYCGLTGATAAGLLACSVAQPACKRSSKLSASASNPCSKRKCSSRDSGDRHIPAQRWCCRAIARYSIAVTMDSSHACYSSGRDRKAWGRSNGSVRVENRNLCLGVSIYFAQ